MDATVKASLVKEARDAGLTVDIAEVEKWFDSYVALYLKNEKADRVKIVETYFADAAIKIAIRARSLRTEKRASVDTGDAEAAIFMFCRPSSIDSTCRTAGESALGQFQRDFLLTEKRAAASEAIELRSEFKKILIEIRDKK